MSIQVDTAAFGVHGSEVRLGVGVALVRRLPVPVGSRGEVTGAGVRAIEGSGAPIPVFGRLRGHYHRLAGSRPSGIPGRRHGRPIGPRTQNTEIDVGGGGKCQHQ